MRIIPLNHNVFAHKVVNSVHLPRPLELGKRSRLALQLRAERVDMVAVHVRVAELDDELVRLGLREVRDEVREERVGRDVEGDAEPEVCGALVEEARKASWG